MTGCLIKVTADKVTADIVSLSGPGYDNNYSAEDTQKDKKFHSQVVFMENRSPNDK